MHTILDRLHDASEHPCALVTMREMGALGNFWLPISQTCRKVSHGFIIACKYVCVPVYMHSLRLRDPFPPGEGTWTRYERGCLWMRWYGRVVLGTDRRELCAFDNTPCKGPLAAVSLGARAPRGFTISRRTQLW